MTAAVTSSGFDVAQRRLAIRLSLTTTRNLATSTGGNDPVLRRAAHIMLRAMGQKDRLALSMERASSMEELIDIAEKIADRDAEIATQAEAIEARGGWV